MRHRVKDKKFNRDSNHRKALLRNLARAVVEYGSITTTVPKAKETKRHLDRLFSRATVDTVANRRILHSFFGKRDVVNTIFEKIIPVMGERTSGFTRITQAGIRRGDNTQMVSLSLVVMPENIGSLKKPDQKDTGKKKTKAQKAKLSNASQKVAKVAKEEDTDKTKTKKRTSKKKESKST